MLRQEHAAGRLPRRRRGHHARSFRHHPDIYDRNLVLAALADTNSVAGKVGFYGFLPSAFASAKTFSAYSMISLRCEKGLHTIAPALSDLYEISEMIRRRHVVPGAWRCGAVRCPGAGGPGCRDRDAECRVAGGAGWRAVLGGCRVPGGAGWLAVPGDGCRGRGVWRCLGARAGGQGRGVGADASLR